MQKLVLFLFLTCSLSAQSQDTIYLGEFGSGIVKNKSQATKYRIVTPDPSEKDVYEERTFYMNDTLSMYRSVYKYYKKKKQVRIQKSYYKSGKIHLLIPYHQGKNHGDFISYWESGKLKRKDLFKNGKFVEGTCWDEEGVEVPFYRFEINPVFPGGLEAMHQYVIDNFDVSQVPVGSTYSSVQVSFYIDTDGSVIDAKMKKTADPMTNYQAIKLVMDMPKWSPAMQDGNPVKVKRTLPIALK